MAMDERKKAVSISQASLDVGGLAPRRVFVIHGRNGKARDALFGFFRAIDLAPIEWEDAINTAQAGAPFIGDVLDSAFKSAQAAVVLLTGDDMARVGTRYLLPHDPLDEKNLTPQARPNVLFEAGMAFGRYPNRTILVALGTLRQFSDIAGRHILYLSNDASSRQALAGRLRTAGCAVETEYKSDWLDANAAGDFDSSRQSADKNAPTNLPFFKLVSREARFEEAANFKHKVWIQLRNEGDECIELRYPVWKSIPLGMKGSVRSATIQIRIGTLWCPEKIGVDRIYVPAGEMCRLWVKPAPEHNIAALQGMCESDVQLGFLEFKANGIDIAVAV